MQNNLRHIFLLTTTVLLCACSMTKDIPEGDHLFIGLQKTTYQGYENTDSMGKNTVEYKNFTETKSEVDAALATAPNGSLFGSSSLRLPFSFGVGIWNKYADKPGGFARWMTKTFGEQPVLMSWVNPMLRSQVAKNVLRNHGYFQGAVAFENIEQKNPKTMKIKYTVKPGRLYTLDSVGYFGFPAEPDSMIHATMNEAYIHSGDAFVVSKLEAERQRIASMLRNNGYYYYQPAYASYLADTFRVDGKAQLRFQLANDVPEAAKHKWYIGHININMRKSARETYTDSISRRSFTIRYSGKRPPLRARIIMADIKLRPRQLYTYQNHMESMSKINANGLFSSTDFVFTPQNDSPECDSLDLTLNCTFANPWDFYVETNFNARTIGRVGPELKLGVTRRNAFRGGEKIDLNLHGSYEWATSGGSSMNNYEYGISASVEFPRIIAPFFGGNRIRRDKNGRVIRRRRYATPFTIAKMSTDVIQRPGYYKMHVVSGEWTYRWQPTAQSRHEFSPLTVKYQFMNSHTSQFDSMVVSNPYLAVTMQDYFIPEMRYTYTYTSPSTYQSPIRWETTLSESGNLASVGKMLIQGQKWNEKGKKMFKNPYSQFLKLETDFTKTWTLNTNSKLVGHINAGIIQAYGNSNWVPNSEMFYAGGANSIRAFSVRGIGPGNFPGLQNKAYSYMMQNGDLKLIMNLEYRRRIIAGLHGAIFLDAGNVWNTDDTFDTNDQSENIVHSAKVRMNHFFKEMALGTGIGLRYDLDFLILRLDWGVALHVPYETGKSGYYNINGFKNYQTLHFAIGYPF